MKSQIRKEAPKSLIYSRAKILRKLFRKGFKNLEKSVEEIDELLYNARIEQLNSEYNTKIPELSGKWKKEWCLDIKEWWNILRERARREAKIEKEKEISEYIEKRFAQDTANPKRVLNSLLERHHSKIILDKVLTNSKEKFENTTLITENKKVKEEVIRHF